MREYFLIYDIEEIGNVIYPNFINCVKVSDGFQRIDDLEKFLLTGEGLGEEIINPRRKGYFSITQNWQKELEQTIKKFSGN